MWSWQIIEVSPKKIGTKKIYGVPVISSTDLPNPEGHPMIIAVGADGARQLIEAEQLKKVILQELMHGLSVKKHRNQSSWIPCSISSVGIFCRTG